MALLESISENTFVLKTVYVGHISVSYQEFCSFNMQVSYIAFVCAWWLYIPILFMCWCEILWCVQGVPANAPVPTFLHNYSKSALIYSVKSNVFSVFCGA